MKLKNFLKIIKKGYKMKSFRDYLKDKEFISEAKSKSSGNKIVPKNRHELDMLVEDESVYLGDIVIPKNITNLSRLFHKSTRKDFSGIENWDVSHVKQMNGMFRGAKNFNEPIGNWNVSNVENMSYMFEEAENFNQPLNNWNVSKVKDMEAMFFKAKKFNQPLDKWNLKNCGILDYMFRGAKAFNQEKTISIWKEKFPMRDFSKVG